jgi:undecaprenyl-diphosphatase
VVRALKEKVSQSRPSAAVVWQSCRESSGRWGSLQPGQVRFVVASALNRSTQVRLLRGLLLATSLLVLFALLTVAATGPLSSLDVALNSPRRLGQWRDELRAIDRIGQRAVCLPLLGIVAAVIALRVRAWRPITVAALGVVGLNVFMLVLKFTLGRGLPRLRDPAFFNGGDIYPSGHTVRMRVAPWVVVGVLSVIMVATSLTLRWHWFTDLLGGLLIGGSVLVLTCTIDAIIPWRPIRGPSRPAHAAGATGGSTSTRVPSVRR